MADTIDRAPTLLDKFDLEVETVLLNGSQAAVRLALIQRERDRRAGLDTAGYVTGYRGSPIAGLEGQFKRAEAFTGAANILFHPGLNEDIAATALWGTQQAELRGEGRYDGVFGIWYGKGPGVDRSGDALRHANHAGTSKHGGVIALMGDDHTCESSTTAHQSEWAFIDAMIPVLHPAGVQEILDYGLHGFALSRYAGLWAGIKCVKDNFESTSIVDGRVGRIDTRIPADFVLPPGGLNIRLGDPPLEREARLHNFKRDAVVAYARANRLDRVVFSGGPKPRFGIVTAGKSYLDTRAAFDELGIDEARAAALGVGLYKVAMIWPFEPKAFLGFAGGLDLVMVVEEKRMIVEVEVKEELYHQAGRPTVVGKRDEQGEWLFHANGALEPTEIAIAIGERILRFAPDSALDERVARLRAMLDERNRATSTLPQRTPYFCAGCPHNSSTVVPEGSRAYAGIGCHYMAQWMDRSTEGFTHMGGEGANWIGEAPFSKRSHVFQNLGDGTYIHSGSLAVRAAIAAGITITYKILFNDAVAMTGGQPLDGGKTVPQIAREMAAEGARRIVIVTDEPGKYARDAGFPPGTAIEHRDDIDRVQKELRRIEGVTVMIYDQTCAAEKRRRRKRGTYPDPAKRVFINAAVCEGCGDCGVKSNCVAILPLETELGRKRQIDQSACNKDYSCLKGFCPSFVTIEGGALRKPAGVADDPRLDAAIAVLPEPEQRALDPQRAILVNGVGGTGVLTIAAIMGEAAYLDGKAFGGIEMTGLAQKGGAVACHVRIAGTPQDINAIRVPIGKADLVIGADLVVSSGPRVLELMAPGRTTAVVNAHEMLTGDFTRNPDMALPAARMRREIETRTGAARALFLDAHALAEKLFGDTIAANMLLFGAAWQLGEVPLSRASIETAIGLNGQSVAMNGRAFSIGRLLARDQGVVEAVAGPAPSQPPVLSLDELVVRRRAFLAAYQDDAWADRYAARVRVLAAAERSIAPGSSTFALAVAEGLFKLMSTKDEYEVARLYTDGTFGAEVDRRFEGRYKVRYHLAPPLLARRDGATGEPRKIAFGPWMATAFRLLARLKRLRGTPFDPFGRTAERRADRRALADYERLLDDVTTRLSLATLPIAVELARLPLSVRGFGHVKAANAARARVLEQELQAALADPDRPRLAAE